MIPYTIFNNQISLFLKGTPYSISKDDKRFKIIKDALIKEEFTKVAELLQVEKLFESNLNVRYENDMLYYKEDKLPACLTDLIVEKAMDKEEYSHYINFFSSLKYNKDFEENPKKRQLFYKNFRDIYSIGDFVIYDSSQKLPIEKFYSLNDFPDSFQNALTTHKKVNATLENLAGFCSDKLVAEFKKEVFKDKVEPNFINFLNCVKGCLDPSLIYLEYPSLKEKMQRSWSWLNVFFNKFCAHNPNKVIELLSKSSEADLSRLSSLIEQDNDYDIVLTQLDSASSIIVEYSREISRRNGTFFFLNLETKFPNIKNLTSVDDYVWVIPQTNIDLADWSNKMKNCISGYAQRAKKGEVLLLGVQKDEKLLYNIEIKSGKVIQFMAKSNSRPDPKVEKKLRSCLKENKIIK